MMKCNSCDRTFEKWEIVEQEESFDHAFGVKKFKSYHCPYCDSEDIEEEEE